MKWRGRTWLQGPRAYRWADARSARWPGGLKPPSPLLACACVGLKPPSPLWRKMGVFGAFFGRRGVVGFSGALFGVSSGVVGFIVAMFLRAAREMCRLLGLIECERDKVRPASPIWTKNAVFRRVGRTLSRSSSLGIPPGELCCAAVLAAGAFRGSSDTTEAGPRRIPPLVACGGRAVGAGKPALDHQCPSLSSVTTAAVASGANAQFFHQPLTVSTAWAPRSVSAEWAFTRPEDRRAAWKREATFSQFTRFHQALT